MRSTATAGARPARRAVQSAAGVAAFAAVLAGSHAAHAPGPTFCGSGGNHTGTVWDAFQTFSAHAASFDRNCLFCHHSAPMGSIFDHPHVAFEIDILNDWDRSSYWAPGSSKAVAAFVRMSERLMPPGKWPDALMTNGPEPEFNTLQFTITNWVTQSLMVCAVGDKNCIWGTDVKNDPALDPNMTKGIMRCNWP
jgi:hypothetical protein